MGTLEKRVKYRSGFYLKDGAIIPKYAYLDKSVSFVKVYNNFLANICQINSIAGNLILYLADIMDDQAIVYNNGRVKQDFIKVMKERGVNYAITSINRAFVELEQCGLLVREMQGIYRVNPQFLSKENEEDRHELMKLTLEISFQRDVKEVKMKLKKELKEKEENK